MERTILKVIRCTSGKSCPFGLKKIDEPCSICRYREDNIAYNRVIPLLIEVKNQEEYICHTKKELPLYNKCPAGREKPGEKCIGCARLEVKIVNSKTEEIK